MRSIPNHTRPIWAEISASRLRDNFHALQAAAGTQVQVLAVIKANAYGHGATECAPILAAAGAQWLGVTSAEEGLAVRASLAILPQGMAAPRILIMCGLWPGEEAGILDRGLTPVVWEPYHLDLLEAEARRRNLPAQSVAVHVEIDTGMARQGVAPGPLLARLLQRFTPGSPLKLEGVMTHLASSEVGDDPQNQIQMIAFAEALQLVGAAGLQPDYVHAGNTSSTDSGYIPQDLPALAASLGAQAMTRAGLALYGYALPLESATHQKSEAAQNRVPHLREAKVGAMPEEPQDQHFLKPHLSPNLQPVMTWKTRIVSLREVLCGDTIGYNATYIADETMRLALLPVGYADGFRRSLSASNTQPGGAVLLHGRRAPIVGRVSMDLTIIDVTDLPEANIGDEVILLGEANHEHIGADDQARLAGTSAYEILCGISNRVPRIVVP